MTLREAPGPGPLAIARDLVRMRADPMWPTVERLRELGPITQARIPGLHVFALYKPEHVEHVFVSAQDNYVKGEEYEVMKPALGEGLVTANGDHWRRQRSLVQPVFAKRHLEPLARDMVAAGEHMLARWEQSGAEHLDVATEMAALTFDVVGRALFGSNLTGDATAVMQRVMPVAMREAIGASRSPLVWGVSTLPGMNVRRAIKLRVRGQAQLRARMREADALVADMIAAHREEPREDLLGLLLDARDEAGGAMSDRAIRDEVMTFLAAGHETTANALTWMWWLLSKHPDARARMYEEVDEMLDGRPPEFADAERLTWTRAVVHETLRLFPPVYMVGRRPLRDDAIDGIRIPAGVNVIVVIYLTHRDPDVWHNPEGFDPSRFLGERTYPRHAFIPFTAGRRVCVGNTFALTEATLLAALIAQRYELDADPMFRVTPQPMVTLRPRDGMPMRLRKRASVRAAALTEA